MKLSAITIAGFRGVKHTLTLQCPAGFLVIAGRNGSGKSTICDAVEFCLTGTIRPTDHKEKGESISDYLWWKGTGAASDRLVRLAFTDDVGNVFEVTRTPSGIAEGSKEILCHLYGRDTSPDKPLAKLCRTSIIRDEEITSLSVDMPEGDRYRFVRDALGAVDVSDVQRRVERLLRKLESQLAREQPIYQQSRRQVADVTARLSDLRSTLVSEEENSRASELLRDMLDLPDADTTEHLETARQALAQGRIQLDRLHRVFSLAQDYAARSQEMTSAAYVQRQEELGQRLVAAETELLEAGLERDRAAAQLAELRRHEPVRAQQAELLQNGEQLGLLPGNHCPLCGSAIAPADFARHIADARAAFAGEEALVADAVSRQSAAARRHSESTKGYERLRSEHEQFTARQSTLEASLGRLRHEARTAGLQIADDVGVTPDQIQQHIEALRNRTQQLEQAVGWLESSRVTELVGSLEFELQQEKQRADEAFAATVRTEGAIAKLKEASKGLHSLVGEVIDEQLSELSPLIEELYKRLRPHVEWTRMRYRLRGDVRRLLSFEVGEGLNPSFMFSSGQRRAAGLAFLLAVHLSRPWCEWRSLILDDPVQHVDDFRAMNLTEVLAAIRRSGQQIICCVEDEALAQLLCRRLRSNGVRDGALAEMHYDRDDGVMVARMTPIGPLQAGVLVPA